MSDTAAPDVDGWFAETERLRGLLENSEMTVNEVIADNARLRAALEKCAADWISAPGTVIGATQNLSAEFRRRMEIAARALEQKADTDEGLPTAEDVRGILRPEQKADTK